MKRGGFRILFLLLMILLLPAFSGEVWAEKTDAPAATENRDIKSAEEGEDPEGEDPVEVKKNGWVDEDGGHYYYVDDVRQIGWQEIEGEIYDLGADGRAKQESWVAKDGAWYYFGKDYRMAKESIVPDSVGNCYVGADGKAVKNTWVLCEEHWYWIKEDYRALTNSWRQDSAGWCYLQADGRAAKEKWILWKGEWYYLKEDSRMATNMWADDSGGPCYLKADGAAARNYWMKVGGEWRYIGSDYHVAKNAWGKDSKGWCYLDSNGKIVSSRWVKWNNKWYYLKSDGYMAFSEWARDSAGWCYLGSDGAMTVSNSAMMKKIENFVNSITTSGMTREQKLRKCFDSFGRFKEENPWIPHYRGVDWPEKYTNHLFNTNVGNCYSFGAAFAYMAKILGYEKVYACNSGGHGWAEINGLMYDPEAAMHKKDHTYYALNYSAVPNYKSSISSGKAWMRVKI